VAALPILVLISIVIDVVLVVRAFRIPKLGTLVGNGLALWVAAWGMYLAIAYHTNPEPPVIRLLLWAMLCIGYIPFIELLYSLARKITLPWSYYLLMLFPIGFTFAASQQVSHAMHLHLLLILQLVLLSFGLPAWYAIILGRAPEGRALWLPTLVFVQIGMTSWATLPQLSDLQGMQLGFLVWTVSMWLIVEGLRLEQMRSPIHAPHIVVTVTAFMSMWAFVVLGWINADVPEITAGYIVALSTLSAWGGILSVVLPVHLFKTRSETQLTQWSSILGDLALFPATQTPPTPAGLANELLNLFQRACEHVVGLRLSVFDDLLVGERTHYGRTLEDRGLKLGRVYLRGSQRCGPFLKLLAPMVGQRLGEVLRSLDWQVQAHTDPLTGLLNRRGFEARLPYALERAMRERRLVTIAMLDLDRFKQVNDRYGHAAGDVLLQAVAEILERNLRDNDLAVRWGGEEFLILLADSDLHQAERIFKRVRARISELRLADVRERVTASVGLAGGRVPLSNDDIEDWILKADDALMRAKEEGRDRIVIAEE